MSAEKSQVTAWRELLARVPREGFIPDVAVIGPVMEDPASWIGQRRDLDGW